MPILKIIVEPENEGLRADYYLANNSLLSRSQIQKLIKENKITLNGNSLKNKDKVNSDDVFIIEYEEKTITDILPQNIPLDIIYEDNDLLVINKPKGIVVHPAPGHENDTIVNALLYHVKELSDVNGYYRPGIVHRIDKDTSGLLVVAKNNEAHNSLAKQLLDKTCYRKYYCLVKGIIENDEGEINAPIGRSSNDRQKMCVTDKNSKEAITEFKVLDRFVDSTLLDVELKTGRTHQIRVHMAYIHHPVLNDNKYGNKIIDDTGQYLHAYYLSFIHPRTNERMNFEVDMPKYMREYIKNRGFNE